MSIEQSIKQKKEIKLDYVPDLLRELPEDATDYERLMTAAAQISEISRYLADASLDPTETLAQMQKVRSVHLSLMIDSLDTLVNDGKPKTVADKIAIVDKIIGSVEEKGEAAFADIAADPTSLDIGIKRGFTEFKPNAGNIARHANGLNHRLGFVMQDFDWVRHYQKGAHYHGGNESGQAIIDYHRNAQADHYIVKEKTAILPEFSRDEKKAYIVDAMKLYRDKVADGSFTHQSQAALDIANTAALNLARSKGLDDFSHTEKPTESPLVEQLKAGQLIPGFYTQHSHIIDELRQPTLMAVSILDNVNMDDLLNEHKEKMDVIASRFEAGTQALQDPQLREQVDIVHYKEYQHYVERSYVAANNGLRLLSHNDARFKIAPHVIKSVQAFGKAVEANKVDAYAENNIDAVKSVHHDTIVMERPISSSAVSKKNDLV